MPVTAPVTHHLHFLLPLLTFHAILHLSLVQLSFQASDKDFAVVVDAGSSGTRVWIYSWKPEVASLPRFVAQASRKSNPGLSSYADDRQAMEQRVLELLDFAKEQVPAEDQPLTSIYILATAGMRLLLESKAYEVFEVLNEIMMDRTINPFFYNSSSAVRILSGEEEGVFAWIAVNYLNNAFDDDGAHHTRGIIELGGASTQIAFTPRGSILADKFPFKIRGKRYAIYAHSYLHYGQDYVERWIMEHLLALPDVDVQNLPNPCLQLEEEITWNGTKFVGTGDPDTCNDILKQMVTKAAARDCYLKPCAIGGVYQPSVPVKQRFYALGVFNIIMRDLEVLNEDLVATPMQVYTAAYEYCKKNHTELLMNVPPLFHKREQFISKPCVMGLYLHLLMTRAYGFASNSQQLIGTEIINGIRADWTLGALIYELENEMSTNNCDVNFGSRFLSASSSASSSSSFASPFSVRLMQLALIITLMMIGLISVFI